MKIAEHTDASVSLERAASLATITQDRHRSPLFAADLAQFSTIPYEIHAWVELKWIQKQAINLHCSILCDSYNLKFSLPKPTPLRKLEWAPDIFEQSFREARLSFALLCLATKITTLNQ